MTLDLDQVKRLVRQTRSERAFEDVEALQQTMRTLNAQMTALPRSRYGLLQDLRASRGRNDPTFESVIAVEARRISEGFRKVAILIATQVGLLQMNRTSSITREFGGRVFLDESQALAWLSE